MENVIGRDTEKKELDAAYNSKDAELIAVYGRRRVGKTFLIKNTFLAKKCIYFQSTGIYKGTIAEQLSRFSKELGDTFYNGANIQTSIKWMDAFDALTQAMNTVPKNKKIVLFFDELPWMATRKSGLIAALEYFWNRHWVNDPRIKLILCGSVASWIIKEIIKNRGGLHNRVTRKIRLLPFNLNETFQFLKKIGYQCTYQQVFKLYIAIGGVPFYLKQIQKNHSVDQNIERLFFNPVGLLFDEFEEVFASLFENSDHYIELISLISSYRYGISRKILENKNKLTGQGGRLTKRLEDLENAGFISSYISYGHEKRGVFYRITDEYCYFYLKWIHPIKYKLKRDRTKNYWKRLIKTPEYFNWIGYTFENICYKHIPQIKKALEIEEYSLSSPWRYIPNKGGEEKGTQIDLLFDREDNAITLCEIKYTDTMYAIDKKYSASLKEKIAIFKNVTRTSKQLFLSMISANGVKNNNYCKEIINSTVILEDLFKREE